MNYVVKTLRDAGLEAKWSRNKCNRPVIIARNPEAGKAWYFVNDVMWKRMNEVGIKEGFEQCTALGELFGIPA